MVDYRPTSSALTALSGNWLCPALDWNLKFDDKDRPTQIVTLALFAQDLGPQKAKMLPITFTIIRHSSKGNEPKGWYKGLGLGIYKCEYDAYDYQGGQWANSSGTKLGVSLLAGYEFNEVWFAEIGYLFAGSISNSASGNVSFNGLSISAGTHVAF